MPCELKEKKRTGVINPIFTCQPAGAQYASIGIKDCIAIVHGGQGCVMFVRLWFSQHYKESFELASSSVHEDGAVFGAVQRVEQAVDVLLMRYPYVKVVPIISTCSTEVIGDDIDGVVNKLNEGLLKEKYADRDIHLIPIHTPSFKGSHVSGYNVAVEAIIKHFAKNDKKDKKLNLLTGWQNPGDVKTLKHLLAEMDVDANVIFDIEEFDAPLMPDGNHVAHGSTTIDDLENTGSAIGTIALNNYEVGKAAHYLEETFDIPTKIGPAPIGIRNTDTFLQNIKELTGKSIPESLVKERGIALDAITDVAHMFLADKRVAIYGHPDLVIGLAEFCLDLEMKPVLLLLGDDNTTYTEEPRIKELQNNVDYDMEIIMNADLWELGDRLQNKGLKLDLILGHSKGRFIAMDSNVPLVRVGFPIFDRAGFYRQPIVGYEGAMILAERMANAWFTDMEYTKNKEWLLSMW
ncbi:Fe-only nitrogenase subunit beta [Pectinatus brassicae]|uniref:Nitrogenase molybdenum-iron protein beta chain n=1 Tax=Pectinatus brassicae TaxID=862415 RepID=A0A840UHR5_9FIRM|nr:Fe-only nitrogenase subunit beta [Pectinatus brassicae]MBB5337281.1 nitrogenase molybdenum-iron protein beta chain [Pectinatus brassicae]